MQVGPNFYTLSTVLILLVYFTTINTHTINYRKLRHLHFKGNKTKSIHNKTVFSPTPAAFILPFKNHDKTWKPERITQKQFEIINMLWRKTKIFVEEENTYPKFTTKLHTIRAQRSSLRENPVILTSTVFSTTSTPSNIEFYYFDEKDTYLEQKECVGQNYKRATRNKQLAQNMKRNEKQAFFVLHLKGPPKNRPRTKTKSSNWSILNTHYLPITNNNVPSTPNTSIRPKAQNQVKKRDKFEAYDHFLQSINKIRRLKKNSIDTVKASIKNQIDDETCPSTTLTDLKYNVTTPIFNNRPKSTTVYDKIKFFEMYDLQTRTNYVKSPDVMNYIIIQEENNINNESKIFLMHVNQSDHNHEKAKHSKKHVNESFQRLNNTFHQKIIKANENTTPFTAQITPKKQFSRKPFSTKYINVSTSAQIGRRIFFSNIASVWAKYPFAAVYIYEPSKVHCDAAGISPHWLVASGSCLSRVYKKPAGAGRSPFVAYCGNHWWQPEMVAYVKYSVVHPWFSPRNNTKRHLYNIGVIQVVSSMSACSGWRPVTLISYQFAADPRGSEAFALGWGLDRYDTRYAAKDLPKTPLMLYKSILHSGYCPGNVKYSKAMRLDNEGSSNVHCLLLPPYLAEGNDLIHGSLLIFGGKLIALYLQEERRPWGEQSAQYTGIWRLVPWIMDVARDPEDIDSFNFSVL